MKRLQAQRLGPEKHFQNQKIDMQCGDQRHQQISDPDHVAFPPANHLPGQASTLRSRGAMVGAAVSGKMMMSEKRETGQLQ
jgi:hypothetical protein